MPKLRFMGRDPKLIKPTDPEFIEFVEGGIPIERLGRRLLPKLGLADDAAEDAAHDGWGDYSRAGFMGVGEDPLKFIFADLMTVLGYGLTPQKVADGVKAFYADNSILHPDYEFIGTTTDSWGSQGCPWECPDVEGLDSGIIYKKELKNRPGGKLMIALAMTSKLTEKGIQKHVDDLARLFGEGHESVKRAREEVEGIRRLQAAGEIFTARITSMHAHEIEAHCLFGGGPKSPYRADPSILIPALNLGKNRPPR